MTESFKHIDFKYDLYYSLIQEGIHADIEKTMGSTRTDILAETSNHLLAIEIQNSPISVKNILKRMHQHTLIGAYTLWLIPEDTLCSHVVHNLRWVKFIQYIQNGILFIPTNTQKVIPARVDYSLKFCNDNILATLPRVLDKHHAIDLEDLIYEKNNTHGVNIVTCQEWWIESWLDLA